MKKTSLHSWRNTLWGQALELVLLLTIVFLIRTFGFGLYQVPTGSMETTLLTGERFFADKLSYWFRKPTRGEIIALNDPTFKYSTNPFKRFIEMYAWGPENWTKRVIGVPGDHVRGVLIDGKPVIYLNGQKLDEPYLNSYPLVYEHNAKPKTAFIGNVIPLSYDPTLPFDKQPFYRINEKLLQRTETGELILEYPHEGRPLPFSIPSNLTRYYGYNADEFDVRLGANEYWLMGDNRRGSGDSRSWGPVKDNIIHARITFRIWSMDSKESWWIVDLMRHPIDFWSRVRWNRFFQFI